jgi:RNA polymerase sigma-70 factor (ECF subfamily)
VGAVSVRTDHQRPLTGPSPADPTDAVLLHALGQRDQAALATLYDRYGGLVYTLALRIVGDRDLAQEVLQDVFFQCWGHAATFRPERGAVSAWLFGIARNRAIDLLRSRQHQARLRERQPLPSTEAPGAPEQPEMGDLVVLRQTVRAALEALPPRQRQAIELAYYGGLPQREIARLLGEPLGTVKTRMRAGLERLRCLLQPLVVPEGEGKE